MAKKTTGNYEMRIVHTHLAMQHENLRTREDEEEKLQILKALHLSQTRAREAERRAAFLAKETDVISNALLQESTKVFASRQLVKVLELQLNKLRNQHQGTVKKKDDDNEGGASIMWFVALALCFSMASLGFALAANTRLDSF